MLERPRSSAVAASPQILIPFESILFSLLLVSGNFSPESPSRAFQIIITASLLLAGRK
jgi:hypothetical protein